MNVKTWIYHVFFGSPKFLSTSTLLRNQTIDYTDNYLIHPNITTIKKVDLIY
jgi:hypothetical protein